MAQAAERLSVAGVSAPYYAGAAHRQGRRRREDRMTSEPDTSPRRRPPTIDLTATEAETQPSATASNETRASAADADNTQGQAGRSRAAGRSSASLLGMAVTGAVASAIGILAALWLSGSVPFRAPLPPSAAPADNAAIADISTRLTALEHTIAARQQDQTVLSRVAATDAAAKAQADAIAALGRRVDDVAAAAQGALTQANTATATAATASSNAADSAKSATQAATSHGDLDALAARIAAVEASVKTLSGGVAQADTARSNLDTLTSRVGTLEATVKSLSGNIAQDSAARGDLTALAGRVGTLESAIKLLPGQIAHQMASADDRAARLAVAAEALRAAVERGASYQGELAAVQSLGADANAVAALAPFAAAGVPSAAILGRELAALMPALQQAANPVAHDGSLLGRLQANAQQLVHITPANAPAGDDPAAVSARIGIEAAHDDIAAALTDIAKLPAAAKPVVAAWVQKAQAREAALASARGIAAAALAALAKPASP